MAIEDEKAAIEADRELLKDPNRREAKRILRNFKGLIGLLDKGDKELSYYEELMQALAARRLNGYLSPTGCARAHAYAALTAPATAAAIWAACRAPVHALPMSCFSR